MSDRSRTLPLVLFARVIVALVLSLTLLSSIAPIETLSSKHLCTMECCKGKPPHLAGECNVSFASVKKKKAPEEPLCGAHDQHDLAPDSQADDTVEDTNSSCHMGGMNASYARAPSHGEQKQTSQPSVAARSMSEPCVPGCGSGALSVSHLNSFRKSVALAYAIKPRPPTCAGYLHHDANGAIFTSAAYLERTRPRGPPVVSA